MSEISPEVGVQVKHLRNLEERVRFLTESNQYVFTLAGGSGAVFCDADQYDAALAKAREVATEPA